MNPNKFARIAESLRQYRRAELKDFQTDVGGNAIDALYVDPLPNNAILNSVLSSNTTFLLGRKGTGKSTVFARAQNELRSRKDLISIYIDVKSLYEIINSSDSSYAIKQIEGIDNGICRAHLLRKAFLGAVLAQILQEIDKVSEEMSLWDKFTGRKTSYTELRSNIDTLRNKIKTLELEQQELPVLQQITKSWKTRKQRENIEENKEGVVAKVKASSLGASAEASAHASASDFDKSLDDSEIYTEYSDIILRSFPFAEIIDKIQTLLEECGLIRLVTFFDDYSELNYVDQRLFVDVILSPLNNATNEAVKLKVAGYPGRVYYGKVDPGKVDTISLDFSKLYESAEVQTMESSAIEYATRLLTARFNSFGENIISYFDSSNTIEEHMRVLFETTFNVPRLMGALLHTCYLDKIAHNKTITLSSIRLAAQKHYENTIVEYFDRLNRYALEPFENKLDRHNQDELMKTIVKEARRVRKGIADKSIGGVFFKNLKNPPVSHFIVTPALASIFQSLEANFLLSRYKETRDKNGKQVIVYALFYGLTESERITWGYPPGRDYRNYFVQRCFDYSSAIHEFLSNKQTIRCNHCGTCYPLERKESFVLFKWKCPECHEGVCEIRGLADDFQREFESIAEEAILEPVEIEILSTLKDERDEMRAGEISSLIDVTYQLVGKRTSKLNDLGFVKKSRSETDNKMRSKITERARTTFFKQ